MRRKRGKNRQTTWLRVRGGIECTLTITESKKYNKCSEKRPIKLKTKRRRRRINTKEEEKKRMSIQNRHVCIILSYKEKRWCLIEPDRKSPDSFGFISQRPIDRIWKKTGRAHHIQADPSDLFLLV